MIKIDRYPPFDLTELKTYSLRDRPSKVTVIDLGVPTALPSGWIDLLPHSLAADALRAVRNRLQAAYRKRDPVVVAIGGHVIKTGCSPYLIDWVKRGLITAVVMNGAAAIHDFELARAGKTSEDVGATLHDGKFGMARDTAEAFAWVSQYGNDGLGQALGNYMSLTDCPCADQSLVLATYRADIPCTVHVAFGTDIVHMHPNVSGAGLGEATMVDFRRLCTIVSKMRNGVWMNIGSAVVLPEVFLKAVSVVRNFGHDLSGLVTVTMDMLSQYRNRANVRERPAKESYELIGHHEIMIPLLHSIVTPGLTRTKESDHGDKGEKVVSNGEGPEGEAERIAG